MPDEDSQFALAAELGVPRNVVRRLGWPAWLPVGDRLNVELPWTPEVSLATLDQTAGAAVLDRRAFLTLSAGTVVTVANQWLALEPPRLEAALRGGRVDATVVECLEQRLPTIRQMQYALGGGSVRNLADAELRLVTDLLSKGTYTEQLGGRMFSIAAELGRVAGWSSFDAGYHAAAERYFMAALRASHAAGDRLIGANVLKCMSLQLVEADRPHEGLAIALAAQAGAEQAPPRIVAMMTVREARMRAVLGETMECERLLVAAESAMNRADKHEVPGWASYFDQAEYCAQVATCYLLLRRNQATDRWFGQALELQPPERRVDRATYLMQRAEAVLGLGDVDHACILVGEAVSPIAAARSARHRRRLRDLQARLNEHIHRPAVAELDERVRTLIA